LRKIGLALLVVPLLAIGAVGSVSAATDCTTITDPDEKAACEKINEYNLEEGVKQSQGKDTPSELTEGSGALVPRIINIMLFIVGILCVVMIIYSGIRYATSAGDTTRVTSSKNTLVYSIVGLIVAILAYAIVNWVVNAL
jgi:hypothetical protein